jgi:hypothetical protein
MNMGFFLLVADGCRLRVWAIQQVFVAAIRMNVGG